MSRVTITSKPVLAYLDKLAAYGVLGTKPGTVATNIIRKELMRLLESGFLKEIQFVGDDGNEDEDD